MARTVAALVVYIALRTAPLAAPMQVSSLLWSLDAALAAPPPFHYLAPCHPLSAADDAPLFIYSTTLRGFSALQFLASCYFASFPWPFDFYYYMFK